MPARRRRTANIPTPPAANVNYHPRSAQGEILAWEEPSNSGANGHTISWAKIADTLKEQPWKWALVRTNKTNNSLSAARASILTGRYSGMTKGEFEASVSKRHTGAPNALYGLYVRYVGTPKPPGEEPVEFGETPPEDQ